MNIQLSDEILVSIFEALIEAGTTRSFEVAMNLQKILNEAEKIEKPLEINEELQLQDKVVYDKQTGFINGQISGKWIVQVQGSTYLVDAKDLKEYNKKPDATTIPHMKFDETTQKLLFEQYIKCGVYQGNIPIKVSNCFVKYSDWREAEDNLEIKVLIEGNPIFMPKNQIKIFENVNDFANEGNYIPGVIIDEVSEEVLENILVNAIDYTNAIGDADEVKIIRKTSDNSQEMQTMPKSVIRTLSV